MEKMSFPGVDDFFHTIEASVKTIPSLPQRRDLFRLVVNNGSNDSAVPPAAMLSTLTLNGTEFLSRTTSIRSALQEVGGKIFDVGCKNNPSMKIVGKGLYTDGIILLLKRIAILGAQVSERDVDPVVHSRKGPTFWVSIVRSHAWRTHIEFLGIGESSTKLGTLLRPDALCPTPLESLRKAIEFAEDIVDCHNM